MDKLEVILTHKDYFEDKMKPDKNSEEKRYSFIQLQKYHDVLVKGKSKALVEYYQNDGVGRMFAKGGLSLQSMPKVLRATIAHEYYYDLDIVNCHPTLLYYLCAELDFNAVHLKQYIDNRDQVVQDIIQLNTGKDTADIKTVILAVLNGGFSDYNELQKTQWLTNFKEEITEIHQLFVETYSDEYEEVKQKRIRDDKDRNHSGSLMNVKLCDLENKVLNTMIDYLKRNEYVTNNFVCCFDGIMIEKNSVQDLSELIDLLESEIEERYNMQIKIKEKIMEPAEMPEESDDELGEGGNNNNDDDNTDNDEYPTDFKKHREEYNNSQYYWNDFMNEVACNKKQTLEELITAFKKNIGRVAIRTNTCGKFIMKISDKNMIYTSNELNTYIFSYTKQKFSGKGKVLSSEVANINLHKLLYGDEYGLSNYIPLYNDLTFDPNVERALKEDSRSFNSWNGFKAKLLSQNKIDVSLIEPLLNIIRCVWSNNDDEIFHYIKSWFHHIFHYPYKKTKAVIMLKSTEQQIGKGFLMNSFLIPYVFGRQLSFSIQGLKELTSEFNEQFMNKLFINVDELTNADCSNFHASFDAVKNRITEPTININIKNGAKFQYPCLANMIFCTNNDFTVKIEESDARYCVLKCNPKYAKNKEFFDDVEKQCSNKNCADHFFSYLYYLDNPRDPRDIPVTELKKEIIYNCLTSAKRFIYRVKEIRENEEEDTKYEYAWESEISTAERETSASVLFGYFQRYCLAMKEKDTYNMTRFGRELNENIKSRRITAGVIYNIDTIKIT